jgi:hypothetical protein
MRQVIADAPENGKIDILSNDVNATCGIAGGSRVDSDKTSFARKTMRHLSARGRAAPLRITAALLAAAWAETQGFPEARPALADALVSAQHVTAARNVDFGGTAGDGAFQTAQASRGRDPPVQLAQTRASDREELQQTLEQEHHRAEMLVRELGIARHDVELLLTVLNKARDESARVKQAAESETAELRKSPQQERERAERLAQDLAAARRDVETQTALAAKASDQSTQLKQAAESGATELRKSLQQERERAEQLAQDLAASRRDIETQTALAARASDESTQLKHVPTALVAFNWPVKSNRFERVARFVNYLFSRIDKLQAPGFDPKWKSINLAATVPGLARFPAAQAWLDRQSRAPQASQ